MNPKYIQISDQLIQYFFYLLMILKVQKIVFLMKKIYDLLLILI